MHLLLADATVGILLDEVDIELVVHVNRGGERHRRPRQSHLGFAAHSLQVVHRHGACGVHRRCALGIIIFGV